MSVPVQSIRNSSYLDGAQNLWPLTDSIQVDALIWLGNVVSNTSDIAIMAQTDDFTTPTAGWGLGFRSGVLTAFAVDNIGETTATFNFVADPAAAGQLLHVGLTYVDGGNLTLYINGGAAATSAMGGATAVNSNVVPWVGAGSSAGASPSLDIFHIVSLSYNDNLTIDARDAFQDAVEFGYFNVTGAGNGMANSDYVYNARYSVQKNPLNFLPANSPAAAVLINQGTTQNAAETIGNLTASAANDEVVTTLPLRVG